MLSVEMFGYAAGLLTAVSQLPQASKAWRKRSVGDLSLSTLLTLAIGLALWVAFGIFQGQIPIVAANAVSLAMTGAVIAAKVRYG